MMNLMPKYNYQPLKSAANLNSESEFDEDEKSGFLSGSKAKNGSQSGVSLRGLILITALNVCVLLLSSASLAIRFYNHRAVLNADYRRVSSYSPVHDLFDLEPTIKKINGTFYPRKDGGSIAREQPNLKADAVWDEWELTRVYPATRQEIIKMGKDPTTVAKLENDIWGLGDDAYATIFDVYHQIHCLNSLRHIAYGNYCKFCFLQAAIILHS